MDVDLFDEWHGFRIRGRYLIGPDGDRMTPERLRGLLFRDYLELRRAGFASRRKAESNSGRQGLVKVVVVDLEDWQAKHFGSAAG